MRGYRKLRALVRREIKQFRKSLRILVVHSDFADQQFESAVITRIGRDRQRVDLAQIARRAFPLHRGHGNDQRAHFIGLRYVNVIKRNLTRERALRFSLFRKVNGFVVFTCHGIILIRLIENELKSGRSIVLILHDKIFRV